MPYDIATMRVELQQYIAPLFAPGATGTGIGESFASMQASDGRLAEQTPASCLIPRDDGNGHAVVDCNLNTASSHAIQEKVLQRIATTNHGRQEVLDFMSIRTAPLAVECQGPGGEMWHKKPWDIERLPPRPVTTRSASARHFACNKCDSATFGPIENVAIAWPAWPTLLTLDDIRPDPKHSGLSEQLFLLAYRCLLQRVSQFRGLIANDDYIARDQTASDAFRRFVEVRQPISRENLRVLELLKTKFDRRLTGIANLPMAHWVAPVEPAFPIASTAFTPVANSYIATTVYPEQFQHPDGTTGFQHWMVLSIESGGVWASTPAIDAHIAAIQQTWRSTEKSIDWTVKHIATEGSLNTYADPEAYGQFCDRYPSVWEQIERQVPDSIVVDWYKRCFGRALHSA